MAPPTSSTRLSPLVTFPPQLHPHNGSANNPHGGPAPRLSRLPPAWPIGFLGRRAPHPSPPVWVAAAAAAGRQWAMRRGGGGGPHLLCPPCPPIGRGGVQEAENSPGVETGPGAGRGSRRPRKAASTLQRRCTGRSSSGCQPRARQCHGQPAPALRAPSGTKELGHRGARGARSQDRCRQAVPGHG